MYLRVPATKLVSFTMPLGAMRVVLVEVTLTVRFVAAVSTSEISNMSVNEVFSGTVTFDKAEMVGGTLAGFTVNPKTAAGVLVNPVGSVTMTVIFASPALFGAGVIVMVRFFPVPPNVILASGTNVLLSETPLTVKPAKSPGSASSTVNAIAAVGVFSKVLPRLGSPVSVGASGTGVMVTENVLLALAGGSAPSPVSVAVRVMVTLPDAFGTGVIITVLLLTPKFAMKILES